MTRTRFIHTRMLLSVAVLAGRLLATHSNLYPQNTCSGSQRGNFLRPSLTLHPDESGLDISLQPFYTIGILLTVYNIYMI